MPWSGASIKTSLSLFAMQVDSYQLLPPQLVSPVAHFLAAVRTCSSGLWLLSGVLLPLFSAGHHAAARRFLCRDGAHLPGRAGNQLRLLWPRRTPGPHDASARWLFAGARAGRDHRRVPACDASAAKNPRRSRSVHAAARRLTPRSRNSVSESHSATRTSDIE